MQGLARIKADLMDKKHNKTVFLSKNDQKCTKDVKK